MPCRISRKAPTGMAGRAGASPLLAGTGSEETHLVVVATADRGLCGGFNTNIVREARRLIRGLLEDGKTVKILTVGKKGREQLKRETLKNLQESAILDGIVKNITEYGAFIDLGGIDGLLHITDMSWDRVGHPSEVVKIDQDQPGGVNGGQKPGDPRSLLANLVATAQALPVFGQGQVILMVHLDRLAGNDIDRRLVMPYATGFGELFPVCRTVFSIVPMLLMRRAVCTGMMLCCFMLFNFCFM